MNSFQNLFQSKGQRKYYYIKCRLEILSSQSKNDKYTQVNEKIEWLTANYNLEEINIDEFLNGIDFNISQPLKISL